MFKELQIKTQGDQWREDIKLINKINPRYADQMKVESRKEKRMITKRHHAHQLKARVIDEQLQSIDKKVNRELRKKIF